MSRRRMDPELRWVVRKGDITDIALATPQLQGAKTQQSIHQVWSSGIMFFGCKTAMAKQCCSQDLRFFRVSIPYPSFMPTKVICSKNISRHAFLSCLMLKLIHCAPHALRAVNVRLFCIQRDRRSSDRKRESLANLSGSDDPIWVFPLKHSIYPLVM